MSEQATPAVRRHAYTGAGRPFIIAVCSGKGGVGKSILTANLSLGIAAEGLPVIIWDADIAFPNQHILYGVEPPLRSSDVLANTTSPGSALFQVAERVRLLAGQTGLTAADVAPESIHRLAEELRAESAAAVLIDTAAGSSDDVLQCCAEADLVLIVVTDEPPSIVDAYGLIKILQTNTPKTPIALVVNNTIDAEDAEEVVKKMNLATERFLKRRVTSLGFVPYDRAVRQSIVEQQPLLHRQPDSEAATAVRSLSRALATALVAHAAKSAEEQRRTEK